MQQNIDIKPALAEDLPEIKSCARSAYGIYVERIGREPAPMIADFENAIKKQIIFVARFADAPSDFLGFVVFYQRGDHLHLENVAIMPNAQGIGIGRRLISFVEQAAREENCKAVELYTNEKMVENLSLYPRLGYKETERRQEDGFNRVYFRKELA